MGAFMRHYLHEKREFICAPQLRNSDRRLIGENFKVDLTGHAYGCALHFTPFEINRDSSLCNAPTLARAFYSAALLTATTCAA